MKKLFTILAICCVCVCVNAQNATVVLNVPTDVWDDSTGYQILMGQEEGALETFYNSLTTQEAFDAAFACGNPAVYNAAEFSIPQNATQNDIVINNSASITIPAGTYYFLILNPSCAGDQYDGIFIASDQCDPSDGVGTFGADTTYTFTLSSKPEEYEGQMYNNDCVTITAAPTSTTSISDASANSVSIYPNPATDVLNVRAEGFNTVEILNFLGQVVYSSTVSNSTMHINTADLTAGVYFVRLNGENTITKKFTKM